MPILSWIGALVVLLVGALTLNGVTQSLEGRDSIFIHFGWVTLILLIGGALFPFWGWTSTGWVLGVAAAWSIVPPLAGRLLGDGVPSGYMYHGDPQGIGDAKDNARSDKNSGGPPPSDVVPDEHHKVEYHKGYPGKLREYRSKDGLNQDESIAQVVPYFAEPLGDSDCYFHGHAVARNCEKLDRLADRIGTPRLSSFGFNDDFRGEALAWPPANVGLKSVTDLLDHLSQLPVSEHSDSTADGDLTEIADDLGRFELALHSAAERDVKFCLVLLHSAGTNKREHDIRQGSFF